MEAAIKKKYIVLIGVVVAALFLSGQASRTTGAKSDNIDFPVKAVSSKTLENGLTVLTRSISPDEMVSIHVTVKAGSGDEREFSGSGITHLVEHMIFKGTKVRGVGAIEKEVKSCGGFINGSVSYDTTDFYITVPGEFLAQAIDILKDMLLDASFDEVEFIKEKEVILKEIKLNNDEPQSRIQRLLGRTAYMNHPYKHPVIGYEDRFDAITLPDAMGYYNRMYVPNRMAIAVVGAIDDKDAIANVENAFRDFRKPDYGLLDQAASEPSQIAERSAEEEAAINLAYLSMGYHSTGLLDGDLFAMDVLAAILGRGNNSRLNTKLFKSEGLVYNISAWNYTPRDPGLFVVSAILDGKNMDEAEKTVLFEMARISREGPTDEELRAVKRMIVSDYIFSLQTAESQANDLASNYLLTGSRDFASRYVDGIQRVTADDIKRVGAKYLAPEKLTVVSLVPKGTFASVVETAKDKPEDRITKTILANGMTLLVREDHKSPTVSISVVMLGGLMVEDSSSSGISSLVSSMLLKGTSFRKESEIQGFIESRGGTIAAFSSFNSFGLGMDVLSAELNGSLDILKDVLSDSVFSQDEIDKVKQSTYAAIKEEDDDIFKNGLNIFREEMFGSSPYALRHLGTKETVVSITREDLVSYYKKYCVPNNMVLSVSGDVDGGSLIEAVKKVFGTLRKEEEMVLNRINISKHAAKKAIEMEKDQSLVLLGFPGADVRNPDRYAIDVMSSVLSGQSGRMFADLRNIQSLAYTLGCFQKTAIDTGLIVFYIATVSDKIADAKTGIAKEIDKIKKEPVTQEELDAAKRSLVSARRSAMQTNAFYSMTSALDELYGLGYDNLYKYKSEIEKVTAEDLRVAALKYFDENGAVEVVISPRAQ